SDGNGFITAQDVYINDLNYVAAENYWSNDITFTSNLNAFTNYFIIAVKPANTAAIGDTFTAVMEKNWVQSTEALAGPEAKLANVAISIFDRKIIDDFDSAAFFSNGINDLGQYHDDDDTMVTFDRLTDSGDYLLLKPDSAADHWYTVIDDRKGFNTFMLYDSVNMDVKSRWAGYDFMIGLRDADGNTQTVTYSNLAGSTTLQSWQSITIPFSAFPGVDTTKLAALFVSNIDTGMDHLDLDNIIFTNVNPVVISNRVIITNLTVQQTNNGSGRVHLTYQGSNDSNNYYYMQTEYSTNSSDWLAMTPAAGDPCHDNVPLAFTVAGKSFTFTWNSTNDIGFTENTTVQARIRVSNIFTNSSLLYSPLFTVDNLVTNAPVKSSPADNLVTNIDPVFSWQPYSDLSGVQLYQVELSSNNFALVTAATNTTALSFAPGFTFADSEWQWRVRVIDNFSNTGPWDSVYNVTIDTTPPLVAVTSGPAAGIVTNQAFNVQLTASESNGYWSTNGLTWHGFVSNSVFISVSNSLNLSYYGRDKLGNNSSTNTLSYVIMRILLGMQKTDYIPNGSNLYINSISTFPGYASNNVLESDIPAVNMYTNNGLFAVATNTNLNFQLDTTGLSDGPLSVSWQARSQSNSTISNSISSDYIIDNTGPDVNVNFGETVLYNSWSYTGSADDMNGVGSYFTVMQLTNKDGYILHQTNFGSNFSGTVNTRAAELGLSNGLYGISFTAYDRLGNSGTSASISVTIDNLHWAPVIGPNPLYAARNNFLLITGLLRSSIIRIFSVNGKLVKKYSELDTGRIEWPLTNNKGQPVAAGIYIIMVQKEKESPPQLYKLSVIY
ncbi:MAG TPA: hypothetical protein VKS21_09725, partial [Spirochaetota bacterium]|nr:hypothetical protein [Spirochaetota bacterium]